MTEATSSISKLQ